MKVTCRHCGTLIHDRPESPEEDRTGCCLKLECRRKEEIEFLPEHHPLAPPSSWGRIGLCAGSAHAQIAIPETERDQKRGERGTLLHHHALRLRSVEGLESYDRDIVEGYWKMRGEKPPEAECVCEVRIRIAGPDGRELTYGRSDELWLFPERRFARLFDLKSHRTSLPEYSVGSQLLAYATGILQEHRAIDTILAQAVAPAEERIYQREFYRRDLPRYEEHAQWVLERARRGGERIPGWEQCTFCRALGTAICPESGALAEGAVKWVEAGGEELIRRTADGQCHVIDDEKLTAAWARVKGAIEALKSWQVRVVDAFRLGAESNHLWLSHRRGKRQLEKTPFRVSELPPALQRLLTEEDLRGVTYTSVAQLENLVGKRHKETGGKSEAEGKRMFRDMMESEILEGEPSYSLLFRRSRKLLS